jgi:hypothetical protein
MPRAGRVWEVGKRLFLQLVGPWLENNLAVANQVSVWITYDSAVPFRGKGLLESLTQVH